MVSRIFHSKTEADFTVGCLETFRFQYANNPIYQEYVNLLGVKVDDITHPEQIPFLPISFFKTHQVYCGSRDPEIIFLSSGTTGAEQSRHPVNSLALYEESFIGGFSHFYGDPSHFCFLCLLPSYLERQGSSLVYMADHLIRISRYKQSGFYLHDLKALAAQLQENIKDGVPTILLGVSYALLDLAEQFPANLNPVIVMETGGMKGKRSEKTKQELHQILSEAFHLPAIHSEYGMTELLSQAYSKGEGLFETPPWMQVLVRDPYDPFTFLSNEKTGGINIIDLANTYSCSFIQTDDLGKLHQNGQFEIQGRMEATDIRGCNLLL